MSDDNELAILGRLPADPAAGCKVIHDAPRIVTARTMLEGALARASVTGRRQSCTTGNRFLDERTGGFLPGWCWVFGATTNWGKSMWAVAVADENLRMGRGVLIVSLEDPEELYADRLMLRRCCTSGKLVSADRLRLGQLGEKELLSMHEVANKGERKPLFVDARSWKGERISKEIGRILDGCEIDLVILDYIQEVHSERDHHSTRDKVSEMARAIRQEVKSRGRALLMLSQVTIGEDPDKWPRMSQIRDSRDVVNAAEVVVMAGTAQADVLDRDGNPILVKGDRGLKIEKVKQGKKGTIKLPWDDQAACFLPVTDGYGDDLPKPWNEPGNDYGIDNGF